MGRDCTFDGPEGFAARVDDISGDGHGAARAARRRLPASHDDRLRN